MNVQFLIAAILTIAGGSLHFYTFEVWIWPKLDPKCFPSFPFGGPEAVMTFYRLVWHFFTVQFIYTAGALLTFTFTDYLPNPTLIARFIALYWFAYVLVSFIVILIGLPKGASFWKTMIRAPQWIVMLAIAILTWWGTYRYQG